MPVTDLPGDKVGGGGGGVVQKKFFSALRAAVWSEKRGGAGPLGLSPRSATANASYWIAVGLLS